MLLLLLQTLAWALVWEISYPVIAGHRHSDEELALLVDISSPSWSRVKSVYF